MLVNVLTYRTPSAPKGNRIRKPVVHRIACVTTVFSSAFNGKLKELIVTARLYGCDVGRRKLGEFENTALLHKVMGVG